MKKDKNGTILKDGDIVEVNCFVGGIRGVIEGDKILIPGHYYSYTGCVQDKYLPKKLSQIDKKDLLKKDKLDGPAWMWLDEKYQNLSED